jgi:GTPase SAR1 family protein
MQAHVRSARSTLSCIVGFKVVMLGDAGVGKTSIVNRVVRNLFQDPHEVTISCCFLTKTCVVDETPVQVRLRHSFSLFLE